MQLKRQPNENQKRNVFTQVLKCSAQCWRAETTFGYPILMLRFNYKLFGKKAISQLQVCHVQCFPFFFKLHKCVISEVWPQFEATIAVTNTGLTLKDFWTSVWQTNVQKLELNH